MPLPVQENQQRHRAIVTFFAPNPQQKVPIRLVVMSQSGQKIDGQLPPPLRLLPFRE